MFRRVCFDRLDRGERSARVARRRSPHWLLGLTLCLGLVMGAGATSARAATIAVDCTTNHGALAGALAAASGGDVLSISGTCTGTFEITKSLNLTSEAGATLDGQGSGPVLTIDAGVTVVVYHLTITGGSSSTASPGTSVGGVYNAGTLTLERSRITGNTASVGQFQNGVGGIFNDRGNLTLGVTRVDGNSASSTVTSNVAVGGVMTSGNTLTPSTLLVAESVVSGNSATTPGVAVGGFNDSGPGTVAFVNSTVSGNSATASGGADAYALAVGGINNAGTTVTFTASTLVGNSASEPNGGSKPPVGGIANMYGDFVTATNSIFAVQAAGPTCSGLATTDDGGYNLDAGTSCGFSTANHSLSNTDPLLDPAGLKDNVGPNGMQSIALEPGSPAIDAIPTGVNGCGTTLTFDERGIHRPQGTACDIGAFEADAASPAQLLAQLATAVQNLGPGTSLTDKIAQAVTHLISGDTANTCSTLTAFINQVTAQTGKKLTTTTANTLIADATTIRNLIGC